MAVQGASGYNYTNYADYKNPTSTAKAEEAAQSAASEETAAAATSEETTGAASTVKQQSETYKPDMDKINQMKSDLKGNIAAFKKMVYSQIRDQKDNSDSTLKDLLSGISGMSAEDAQKAISDDGEWGVNATANRILDFAKALSGGDPEKIELLRDAVNKGFAAAGKVWGGDLPEISQQTLSKVMEGFDKWAADGNADGIGSAAK